MESSLDWYFVDLDGESKGPITTEEVKQLPSHLFVWNGSTVSEWTEIDAIQHLLCALPPDDANAHENATPSDSKLMTLSALAQLTHHQVSDEEVVDEPIEEPRVEGLAHSKQIMHRNISDQANTSKAVANDTNTSNKKANMNAVQASPAAEDDVKTEEASGQLQSSLQRQSSDTMEISHTINTVSIHPCSHSTHDNANANSHVQSSHLKSSKSPKSPQQLHVHSDLTDEDIAKIDGMPTLPPSVELASPAASATHAHNNNKNGNMHPSYKEQKSLPSSGSSPTLPDAAPEIRQSYTEPVHGHHRPHQKSHEDIIACSLCTFHNAYGAKKCVLCFTPLVYAPPNANPSSTQVLDTQSPPAPQALSFLAAVSLPQQRQRSNGLMPETYVHASYAGAVVHDDEKYSQSNQKVNRQKEVGNHQVTNATDGKLDRLMRQLGVPSHVQMNVQKLPRAKKLQMIAEYEKHHALQASKNNKTKSKSKKKLSKNNKTTIATNKKALKLKSVFSERRSSPTSDSTNNSRAKKEPAQPPRLQGVMSSTLHYQSNSKKAIANKKQLKIKLDSASGSGLQLSDELQKTTKQSSSGKPKHNHADKSIASNKPKAKTKTKVSSTALLCAYDGYVTRHGKPPHNATQLMKFSKTDARYQPLSFAQARKLLFDKNKNGRNVAQKQSKKKRIPQVVKVRPPKTLKTAAAAAAGNHKETSRSDKDIQSIWDVNENEDDDETDATYKKRNVLNGYTQHLSAIREPTAQSVMKHKMGIISPMTQPIKSVFDDSSTDDDEQRVDAEDRLTVNMKDAKHINVSSHFQQRL